MASLAKGFTSAALRFFLVGVALPWALDFFSPLVSAYVKLPPSSGRWTLFLAFGALFAITGFLQNAYRKGDYPWLVGKIGGGVADLAFFSYVILFLPSAAAVGSQSFRMTGLLALVYAAVALAYLYLALDFFDARRTRSEAKPAAVVQTRKSDTGG